MEDVAMRRMITVLLLIVASTLYAGEKPPKAAKAKDKRFEMIVVNPAGAVGSYRGPAESYGLVLETASDGTLRGNYVEMGRVAVLSSITLRGTAFSARASFDDGSTRTITGSFANRTLNGATAFGLRMRAIPLEGYGSIDTFFERF
jgi:hypothetical protein